MSKGPLDLVGQIATILDELDIPYALGGSLASSLIGERRSTVIAHEQGMHFRNLSHNARVV